jgi:hypothetical protein
MKSLLILGIFAGFANAQTLVEVVKTMPLPERDGGSWKTTTAGRMVVVQATDAVLPWLLNDKGHRSVIRMVNLESSTANYIINFMTAKGEAMVFPLVGRTPSSELRGTIPPNGILELTSTGEGQLVLGWGLALSTSARVATSISIQEQGPDGSWLSSTHQAANASVQRMKVPFDNTDGSTSYVIFCNVNVTGPTPATVIVRGSGGEELGRTTYALAGWGQYSLDVTQISVEATGRTGTVEFVIPQTSELGIGGVSVKMRRYGIDLLDALALTSWAN